VELTEHLAHRREHYPAMIAGWERPWTEFAAVPRRPCQIVKLIYTTIGIT
jgi:hypothetical protein